MILIPARMKRMAQMKRILTKRAKAVAAKMQVMVVRKKIRQRGDLGRFYSEP